MNFLNKLKKVGTALVLISAAQQGFAQQEPQFAQYMYNTSVYNPAYAGTREVLSVFGNYRTQWVGLDGAPKTASFSVSTPINDSNVGLGLSFVNDKIGIMDENNIAIDFSYKIKLNYNYQLAFGLKASADLLNVDYTKGHPFDPSDINIQENISNKFTPNIGAGVYLYSDRSYLGVSVPSFLETHRYDDNDVTTMKQRMQLYLIGGYVFDINPDLKFKPAFLVKTVQGAPLQIDLTANFLIFEKLTAGVAYRWDAAVSGLVGFQISESLFVGYSYDADTSKLKHYNSGSHEFFLRADIFNRYTRKTSPRFF